MSLLKRMEARMMNAKLNENFNREVSKSREIKITEEEKRNYAQVHKSFEAYKKRDPNWKQHFE